ncbi:MULTISPECIES: HAD family hydrolase [Phocaeicola]|uniref:Cell surface protein n=2 Tax=Phocaeicola TaxID=909656 RepID=A0A7J5MA44_PHOVU|nr:MULTISPECIES: hypothetical protein [Phocaeicola]KAB5435464.1 hypothetical protein F9Z94_15295 [Phocaeicola vulgatus]TWV67277.1 hypothetical protein FSA04_18725 [Phocaeicola dorei]TWV85244.1 hypothetical protein FSA02_18605 [Phocaeicola dorei]
MNKKFLSAVLFGALMVSSTGTFVSCKDYDDDIEELWGAVNGGKEDLSKKVSALETSVSDLQSAQTKLEAEIAAAKKEAADAKAAALQAEKNAIEAAKAEIAKVKEELVKMIQNNQGASEEDIKAIESEIATIKGDITALTAAYKGADAEILDKLSKVEGVLGERITNLEADVKTNKEEIGKLQSALKLQQDALDAYKEATGKELGDVKTKLEACEKAVEALQGFDVAETKAAIEQLKNDYKKIAEEITKINTNLDVLSSAIYTGVTHVSLVNSESNNQGKDKWNLDFESVLIQKNIFGDEWTLDKTIANKLEFKGGTQDQKSAKFLIRVSPTNANLDASMISLQDSKGEKLDIVEVKNITPYDELLTGTRGISKGGLWVVEVALKNYDEDSFNAAATNKDGKKVLYAVAVDNTKEDETAMGKRNIISTYDLTLKHGNFDPSEKLNFFVDDTNVNDINNRYTFESKSITGEVESGSTPAKEYKWTGNALTEAFDKNGNVLKDKDGNFVAKEEENQAPETGDNRSNMQAYPAVQNKAITISLKEKNNEGKWVAAEKVKAMYVTFDKKANAVESAPSEWNAWNSYKYEGLNTVVEGTTATIKISPNEDQEIINDFIGFRVYAVNLDGTLVDPDGRAFYVKLGEAGVEIPSIETKVIATTVDAESGAVELSKEDVAKLKGLKIASYEWAADGLGDKVNGVTHIKANGFQVTLTAGTAVIATGSEVVDGILEGKQDVTIPTNINKATIVTKFNENLGLVLNDTKLNGTLTLKNADGFVLATIKVSAEKVLPTAEPAEHKITAKDNQIVNGVYNCFLIPSQYDMDGTITWDAQNGWGVTGTASEGTMNMENVFNGWKNDFDGNSVTSGYRIVLANTKYNNDTKDYTDEAEFGKNVTITNKLINSETKHATDVEYVYAGVSAYVDNNKVLINQNHAVKAYDSFNTVYNCYMHKPVHTWRWIEAADKGYIVKDGIWYSADGKVSKEDEMPKTSAVYAEENFEVNCADIFGVNTYNSTKYGVDMTKLNLKEIRVVDAKITSNGSKDEDYFVRDHSQNSQDWGNQTIKFRKNSSSTNPTADVASTLTVVYVDMYGHVQTAEVGFTVKKQ